MKITNKQIRQIIKEELEAVLNEETSMSEFLPMVMDAFRQMEQKHDEPDRNLTVGRMLKSKDISSIFKGRMANSPKAGEIKRTLNLMMHKMKAQGLDINQIATVIENAGREVFGTVPDGAINFIRQKGGSGGSVRIDDPMMESQVFYPGKNPNLEMSPREKVDAAMDEIPDAGGSIMGSPGARLKEELLLIADAIDDPEELKRLSAIVDEREAINLLSSLGYEDGIDNNRS